MRKRPNEQNERVKRRFMEYRKHARQLSEKSLDKELAALERFDVWNGAQGFRAVPYRLGNGVPRASGTGQGANGKLLGKSTTRAIIATLREFTLWLSQQEGYRSRIKPGDADYFRLSRRDEAEARAAPRTTGAERAAGQVRAGQRCPPQPRAPCVTGR